MTNDHYALGCVKGFRFFVAKIILWMTVLLGVDQTVKVFL